MEMTSQIWQKGGKLGISSQEKVKRRRPFSTCGKSTVEALPSCEKMSWSLLTKGMTDCPRNAAGWGEGDRGTPAAWDPEIVDAGDVKVGCAILWETSLGGVGLWVLQFQQQKLLPLRRSSTVFVIPNPETNEFQRKRGECWYQDQTHSNDKTNFLVWLQAV